MKGEKEKGTTEGGIGKEGDGSNRGNGKWGRTRDNRGEGEGG
jgi:hypothetical protein